MVTGSKKRIGIIRGGEGRQYASSLKKGGEIINYIFENLSDKYKVFDIFIDKDNVWHCNGVQIKPSDLFHKVDMVWNISHPSVSVTLHNFSIPNIGINAFSSSLENSKDMLREHMKKIDLPMPRSIILPLYQVDFDGPLEIYTIKKAKEIHDKFAAPWIVKSYTEDTSMGIHLAKTFNELVDAIEDGVKHGKSILVEEFIGGKVASIHSVLGFRMGDLPAQAGKIYTFPLGNTFGIFSKDEKEKLISLAKDLHRHIDAGHYMKSDFILTPRNKVYLLSVEFNPDLNSNSHFSEVCVSVGAKTSDVIEHILR